MFTGIVEEQGTVTSADVTGSGAHFTISAPLVTGDLRVGASIAVNGACLTAVEVDPRARTFAVDLVVETLDRTSLGRVEAGARVNLERAMPAGGRFDGHVVQGHVDGVGRITSVEPEGNGRRIGIELGADLLPYVVEKGSITLDGVSLTVAAVTGVGIEVALIPHTLEVTTFGSMTVGDPVNVEVDVLAKYVERLMEIRS